MLVVAFLLLSFLVGVGLLSFVWKGEKTVLFAGGLLTGVLIVSWLVYFMSFMFSFFVNSPLLLSNACVIVLMLFFVVYFRKRLKDCFKEIDFNFWSIGVSLVVGLIFSFLFYYTFRVQGDSLLVGATVYSDFGPHLAMIRSFSLGNNFFTIYPHFPASDVKYHFMFDFAVGNLEFLGLPIDHAFNGLSLLSIVGFCLLLFQFAYRITGNLVVSVLTLMLWFFRSSLAFWNYLASDGLWGILGIKKFIGETVHEDWGLWNQNVYLNQRHLVFAWGVLILILLLFYSNFSNKEQFFLIRWWRGLFGNKKVFDWKKVLFCGLILGLLGFWNGAVAIVGVLILGTLMMFSSKRQEFLVVLMVSLLLIYLQKIFFIEGVGLEPKILFGFLAEKKSSYGIFLYYVELLGVWIPVLFATMFVFRKYWKLIVAFMIPFLFANVLVLTPAVEVNHKYIMISVCFLNIFIAWFLVRVFQKSFFGKAISIALIFLLIVTGFVDILSILNMDKEPMVYKQGNLFNWVNFETDQRSVFLTEDMPVSNDFLLAGRFVYYGWPYYAWGAGYNTLEREGVRDSIYRDKNWDLARNEGIDYVVYDVFKPNLNVDLDLVYKDEKVVVFKL
jgi:hypothetical protein